MRLLGEVGEKERREKSSLNTKVHREVLSVYMLQLVRGSNASSIFLEGLKAHVLVVVNVPLLELFQPRSWSDLLHVGGHVARSVIRVLDFHADEGRFVDEWPCLGRLPRRDPHVQLKALIRLILAILDAGELCWRLCRERLTVHAIKVASAEEKLGETRLHQSVSLVLWVLRP